MSKLEIPKHMKSRLDEVGRAHAFTSGAAFAEHLVERGLLRYAFSNASDPLDAKLEQVASELGYSSSEEVIEHLLERGLLAYTAAEPDRAKLEARLRGLGYID
jgi:hypothetical protein